MLHISTFGSEIKLFLLVKAENASSQQPGPTLDMSSEENPIAPRGLTPSGLLAFSPPIPILPPLAYPLGLDSTVTSEQESVTMVGSDGGSTTAVESSDAGSVTSGGKKPLKERPKVLETIMENFAVQTRLDGQQTQKPSRPRWYLWAIIVVLSLFGMLFGTLWTQVRKR
jgi:cobalamin biosynthesis Mg chelatase CobN